MVAVTFAWSPSLLPGATQFLDLSLYDIGFAAGLLRRQRAAAGKSIDAHLGRSDTRLRLLLASQHAGVRRLARQSDVVVRHAELRRRSRRSGVQPNPGLLQLRDNLAAAISDSGFNVAVAVTDLQTGESIDVKGDDPRHAGCTANWFVLLSERHRPAERALPGKRRRRPHLADHLGEQSDNGARRSLSRPAAACPAVSTR